MRPWFETVVKDTSDPLATCRCMQTQSFCKIINCTIDPLETEFHVLPHRERNSSPVKKTSQLVMDRDVMSVCSKNNGKHKSHQICRTQRFVTLQRLLIVRSVRLKMVKRLR